MPSGTREHPGIYAMSAAGDVKRVFTRVVEAAIRLKSGAATQGLVIASAVLRPSRPNRVAWGLE